MGEKEPRACVSWGEMGGGRQGASTQAGPGRPGPQAVSQTRALGLCNENKPPGPGGAVQAPPAVRGGWTEPGAEGAGSGAWSTHLSRATRSSRRLWALQPPPGHPEGGQGGKQQNGAGGSSAPTSCGDPSGFLLPG